MTMNQIREKARLLGVKNYSRLRKADLIRAIQGKEGNLHWWRSLVALLLESLLENDGLRGEPQPVLTILGLIGHNSGWTGAIEVKCSCLAGQNGEFGGRKQLVALRIFRAV